MHVLYEVGRDLWNHWQIDSYRYTKTAREEIFQIRLGSACWSRQDVAHFSDCTRIHASSARHYGLAPQILIRTEPQWECVELSSAWFFQKSITGSQFMGDESAFIIVFASPRNLLTGGTLIYYTDGDTSWYLLFIILDSYYCITMASPVTMPNTFQEGDHSWQLHDYMYKLPNYQEFFQV